MVPAENTMAPLLARYSVRLWVTVPGATVAPKFVGVSFSVLVVDESWNSPAGRNPLSTSTSYS